MPPELNYEKFKEGLDACNAPLDKKEVAVLSDETPSITPDSVFEKVRAEIETHFANAKDVAIDRPTSFHTIVISHGSSYIEVELISKSIAPVGTLLLPPALWLFDLRISKTTGLWDVTRIIAVLFWVVWFAVLFFTEDAMRALVALVGLPISIVIGIIWNIARKRATKDFPPAEFDSLTQQLNAVLQKVKQDAAVSRDR